MRNQLIRNPLAIIKWNFRELGRSPIILQSVSPVWEECTFSTLTARDALLEQAALDIEVWDSDLKDTADFLGCVRLQGDDLVSFLGSEEALTLDLKPSKRLADSENLYVQGTVTVSGTAKVMKVDDDGRPDPEPTLIEKEQLSDIQKGEEDYYLHVMFVQGIVNATSDLRCSIRFNGASVGSLIGTVGQDKVKMSRILIFVFFFSILRCLES